MQNEQINDEIDDNTGDQDYLEAIQELKENSVPKADFDKLKQKNKELLQMVVNGETLPAEENPESNEDKKARLRKELYSGECELNNLEYCVKTLELRDILKEETGEDPFLPKGPGYNITKDDIEAAEKTATIIRECINNCNGDSGVFTSLLSSRIPNDPIMNRKGR